MVDISNETAQETDSRLSALLPDCRVTVHKPLYGWVALPPRVHPFGVRDDALALVQDQGTWSQLVPADDESLELFKIFTVHFPERLDNSGFVGWLASRLKSEFGTGVFVVCGYNPDDGGIYDHWGCPAAIAAEVLDSVRKLVGGEDLE